MEEFKPYNGDYEKEWYDVKLKNGTILEKCWPNAGSFFCTVTMESVITEEIDGIRKGKHPMEE